MTDNALNSMACPPKMSDGRFATDYRPSCYMHDMIMKQNGLRNSEQMRMFLTHNAEALMQLNSNHFQTTRMCPGCTVKIVDPNGNDRYWAAYRRYLGWQ